MASIKRSEVTVNFLGIIGILLIMAWLLVPATQAKAETMKYKYTTQLTKVEWVAVPDEKGHILGLYERRGVVFFENEVTAIMACGTFEKVKGQVSFQGYSQITFKDGSTSMQMYQGIHAPAPGEKLDSYKNFKGEYIKGTGRFEGIKGKFSATGKFITPPTKDKTKGDNWVEVTATYTLPKK